jgi:uncharacterized protein (TIGR02594 family)
MGSINQKAFEIMKKEIGVCEGHLDQNNPRILEYHATTTLKADSDKIPWCSSFMNWCILQAGGEPTGSALAKSWLSWGVRAKRPVPGDIVVLKRGTNGVFGHVGFLANPINPLVPWIYVLGGNQGDRVCVKIYSKFNVIDYRR